MHEPDLRRHTLVDIHLAFESINIIFDLPHHWKILTILALRMKFKLEVL